MELGDAAGDGVLDAVILDFYTPSLRVFVGLGDGTFAGSSVSTALPTPGQYVGLALGDVNNDGKLDAVVGETLNSEVLVLLGNGNGTFQQPGALPPGPAPQGVYLADLNSDGKLDLLETVYGGSFVVYFGNGDGTFGSGNPYNTPETDFQLAIADINGDGSLDVAAANCFDESVSVFYNNGSGNLGVEHRFNLQSTDPDLLNATGIAVGDFDHDGLGELAVTVNGNNAAGGLLLVNPRTSDVTSFSYSATPGLAAAGDVNLDGYPDAITAWYGAGTVVVWYGLASGGLDPYPQVLDLGFGSGSYRPLLGDLDSNGVPDLVVGLDSVQFGVLMNLTTPPHGDQAPPDWLQQIARSEGQSCDAGWHPSWAEWPNDHSGGFVCTGTLRWTPARWVTI